MSSSTSPSMALPSSDSTGPAGIARVSAEIGAGAAVALVGGTDSAKLATPAMAAAEAAAMSK